MPTALVGLPGSVLSNPMIEHALFLKNRGLSVMTTKKMAAGSLIRTAISSPRLLLIATCYLLLARQILLLLSSLMLLYYLLLTLYFYL